jgi:predicted ABC-type sugar transport system permease subunit
MSSIISSLADLVKSIVEVIYAFFETAGHLVLQTVNFVFSVFQSIINVFLEFGKGLVDLAGGIVGFVLGKSSTITSSRVRWAQANCFDAGNIAVLAVLAVAAFGFLQYQRRQGNTVQVGNKKLN